MDHYGRCGEPEQRPVSLVNARRDHRRFEPGVGARSQFVCDQVLQVMTVTATLLHVAPLRAERRRPDGTVWPAKVQLIDCADVSLAGQRGRRR
jgi:hypothetical protein